MKPVETIAKKFSVGPKNANGGSMLYRFLFCCRSCEHPATRGSFPLCEDCSTQPLSAPPLCRHCGSHICVLRPDRCFGSKGDAFIDSYTARYLLIEPGYTVLKSWKKHGGPLFDRFVLKANTEFISRIRNQILDPARTVVVPVPQSFERSWRLGRSPALTVAQWISKETKLPLEADLLALRSPSSRKPRQAQLGLERRLQTPSQVIATDRAIGFASSRQITTIVLVDDFMTSGHTLRNTALALKEAGFPSIHAVVLGYRPRQTFGEEESASLLALSEPSPSEEVSLDASFELSGATGVS